MRKEDKLRPYRVDYFDIEEMKDNDFALVRSEVVRAVTAINAIDTLLGNYPAHADRIIIRAGRYYKNVTHKDVFKPIEDLFTANKAVTIMEGIETYRRKKNEKPCPTCGKGIDNDGDGNCAVCTSPVYQAQQAAPAVSNTPNGHFTRFSDSSLYDEVCTNCGATDTSGKLNQPCPNAPVAVVPDHTTPDPAFGVEKATFYKTSAGTQIQPPPTSGPDSPATVAVVADLNGMLAHDEHEQAMDTFVPTDIPEGKRFPDPTNASITVPTDETTIQTFEDYLHEHQELSTERIAVGDRNLTWSDIATEMKQKTALGAACLEALSKDESFKRAPTSWTYGMGAPCATSSVITEPIKLSESEPLIEPDQAVGPEARPTYKPQFFSVGDAYRVAGVVIIVMATLLYFILRSH